MTFRWLIEALFRFPASRVLLAALLSAAILRALRAARCRILSISAGAQRTKRHHFVLPRRGGLPALPLDIQVAGPPRKHAAKDAADHPLILYVLDPEPLLFGMAALFSYAQAGYYPMAEGNAEAQFRRLFVVGVGHSSSSFALDAEGFDSTKLRNVRRRDFPPWDHPAIRPGGGSNPCAARFVEGLVDEVIPYVEGQLLGLRPGAATPERRCLMGASYSAVVALQVMLARPAFKHFALGSPSVCFDPAILEDVRTGAAAGAAAASGARVGIWVGAREHEGTKKGPDGKALVPGNVHDKMVEGCRDLAEALRDRGVVVDGVHELPGEDHGTMKPALVSRGLMWFAQGRASV
mmetsp:Transcript_35374/g.101734  ORF Transcript_35374/g.101734 Transcript_35374/m.101734 type:complete len:350 (+) Transcript_35374:43-1092(+)